MKIVRFVEGESFDDLSERLDIDREYIEPLTKKLVEFNILKKKTKKSNSDTLKWHEDEEDNNKKNYTIRFVGILHVYDICIISYPKYETAERLEKDYDFKILRQVVKTIEKYKLRNQEVYEMGMEKDNFNLLALTLEMLGDYYEYGLYTHNAEVVDTFDEGEILWDKTILESTMYLSNGSPIYLDLYRVNNEVDEYNFFRRLHATILTEMCSKVSDILEILGIEVPNLTDEHIDTLGSREYLIYRLDRELSSQFITYNQKILKSMKSYLVEKTNDKSRDISYVGTTSFDKVWEAVCCVYKNDCKNKFVIQDLGLELDTYEDEKLIDIASKPQWTKLDNDKETVSTNSGNKALPDIMTLDKESKSLNIYDAKYYTIKWNEDKISNNPGIGDVMKQYFYELLYTSFANENGLEIKENAFLVPGVDGEQNIGEVKLGGLHSVIQNIKCIKIIELPCDKVYDIYLKR